MKKSFIFIILIFLNFNILHAKANNKISFVDLNYILTESISGKKILNELNNLSKQNEKQFKSTEFNLNKKKDEIKKQKNIISQNEYQKKINEFQSDLEKYNREKSLIIKKFENLKKKELDIFFDSLNEIMSVYMKENDINIIIEKKSIIMANKISDITNNILELVNKKN
jgi:Skp family chaperone for outer membrane proteins